MTRISFFIIIIMALMCQGVQGQELGLQFMEESIRTGSSNPGQLREHFISIGLPSVYANYGYNGPTMGSILNKDANGQYFIDVDKGLAALQDENFVRLDVGLETFNFDVRLGKLQVGLSHAVRQMAAFEFPRELPEVIFNGNSQYIDQDIDVGPSLDARLYSELAAGVAYQVNDKLSAGGRLKYLSGVGNISSDKHQASIYTDPEYYQITATTDYELNVAGSPYSLDIYTELDSSDFNFQMQDAPFGDYIASGNNGFAVDLGVVYEVNDKLTLGASLLDLGTIKWNTSVSNFKTQGSYTFDGIDAGPTFFEGDSLDFDPILDTVAQVLGVKVSHDGYSTAMPTRFFINGTYEVIESLEVGASLYGEVLHDKFHPAFALSVQKEFGEMFQVGAIWAFRNQRASNFGLNFSAKFGPVQLYAVSDNIPSVFVPYKSKNVNFRVGLNILLAKKERDEE
jgi:hypothetical protein